MEQRKIQINFDYIFLKISGCSENGTRCPGKMLVLGMGKRVRIMLKNAQRQ
jgi:hypothetical protein